MIPAGTYKVIGQANAETCAARHDPCEDYLTVGVDLNDLAALALRLESAITDADELRDWKNRIVLILDRARIVEPGWNV